MWARLMVNAKSIGFIEIQRETVTRPRKDDVCSYVVRTRVNGESREAHIKHRYGDGPMVLLAKAFTALTEGEHFDG